MSNQLPSTLPGDNASMQREPQPPVAAVSNQAAKEEALPKDRVDALPHTVETASSTAEASRPPIVAATPLLWTPSIMRIDSNPLTPAAQEKLQDVHQQLRGWESMVELPFGVADGSACPPGRNVMHLPTGYEPTPSYYVRTKKQAPSLGAVAAETPLSLLPPATTTATTTVPYQPRKELDTTLPVLCEGRAMEQYRFFARRPTPMRIPIYDQACLKYLFTDSFDGKVDPSEWVTAISFVVSILVNAASAISNMFEAANGVDSSDPNNPLDQQWIIELSKVIFAVELAVIWGLLIGLIITIIHAVVTKNLGTDLATDVVALGQRIAGFSSIKIVGWVSPAFASRLIMPQVKIAVDWRKKVRVVFYILAYLGGCALATATVTLKVTQIAFTGTTPIGDWSSANWLSLIGFVLNLAKVDDSYFTETKVLLSAVHQHFCTPGEPTDEFPASETLYSRAMRYFGIPRDAYYEYFEVVFDYHETLPDPSKPAADQTQVPSKQQTSDTQHQTSAPPARMKTGPGGRSLASMFTARAATESDSPQWAQFLRFMNFLTFVLKIDNYLLRKFLQMSSSPLLFYEQGRQSFQQAYEEHDIVGMNLALWRSDPEDRNTLEWSMRHEQCFNVVFRCDEGIRVLRSSQGGNVDNVGHPRTAAMEASSSLSQVPLSSMEIISLLAAGRNIVTSSSQGKADRPHPTSVLLGRSPKTPSSTAVPPSSSLTHPAPAPQAPAQRTPVPEVDAVAPPPATAQPSATPALTPAAPPSPPP